MPLSDRTVRPNAAQGKGKERLTSVALLPPPIQISDNDPLANARRRTDQWNRLYFLTHGPSLWPHLFGLPTAAVEPVPSASAPANTPRRKPYRIACVKTYGDPHGLWADDAGVPA